METTIKVLKLIAIVVSFIQFASVFYYWGLGGEERANKQQLENDKIEVIKDLHAKGWPDDKISTSNYQGTTLERREK